MKVEKIIHVNRQIIAKNNKDGYNRQVFIVRKGKNTTYGSSVKINGPCELVYNSDGLSCGAKAYIKTSSEVEIENPEQFKNIKK